MRRRREGANASDFASAPGAGDDCVLGHTEEAGEDVSRESASSRGRSRPAREFSGLALRPRGRDARQSWHVRDVGHAARCTVSTRDRWRRVAGDAQHATAAAGTATSTVPSVATVKVAPSVPGATSISTVPGANDVCMQAPPSRRALRRRQVSLSCSSLVLSTTSSCLLGAAALEREHAGIAAPRGRSVAQVIDSRRGAARRGPCACWIRL